jgi:hypothetical protein
MRRAGLFALCASSAFIAGAAQAQQICCVPQQPARPDGLRGYAQPQPQYAPPQYGEPQYPDRPSSSGLRGYVGVEYAKTRSDPGTPSPRVETWAGEGAVSGQMGGFGVQGDIRVANYDVVGGGDTWVTSPTLHVFQRNPYGLIGGWAGWSHSGGSDLLGLGAEGQAYMSNATLYGSVGYGHVSDGLDQNLWSARVEGRYYATENLALNAHAGLVRTSMDTAAGARARSTVRTVGFGAEFQPGSLPFSILAGYSHADASNSSAESDTLRVGLRWNFDGGSLAERDRLGATLNNVTDQFLQN